MADVPVSKAAPPDHEGVLPELNTDDGGEEEKICLSDLHQVYIDRICNYLDLKSAVRLQMANKDLSTKGFVAQRLISQPLRIDYWYFCKQPEEPLFSFHIGKHCLTEEEFNAMNFRFDAEFSVKWFLTVDAIKHFNETLEGRGAIKKVKIGVTIAVEEDLTLLSQFLQDWNVSELEVQFIRPEYLHVPGVKKLNILRVELPFPLSLIYFLNTNIHTCSISLAPNSPERTDSDHMHAIMKKWASNEKVIKNFRIENFNCNEESLLFGWKVITRGEEVPSERPFVIRPTTQSMFRLVRADGAVLSMDMDISGFVDMASFEEEDRPFSEDEPIWPPTNKEICLI